MHLPQRDLSTMYSMRNQLLEKKNTQRRLDLKSQRKPDKRCPFTLHCDWSSPVIIQQILIRLLREQSVWSQGFHRRTSPRARSRGPEVWLIILGKQRQADGEQQHEHSLLHRGLCPHPASTQAHPNGRNAWARFLLFSHNLLLERMLYPKNVWASRPCLLT